MSALDQDSSHPATRIDATIGTITSFEMSSDNAGARAEPGSTALPRRIAALGIDLLLVGIPALILAAVVAERFTILDDSGPRPRFELAEQERINEIDQGANRALQLGDMVYTLSGSGLWLTVAALVVLTATVFFLIPAARGGQGLGRTVLRIPREQRRSANIDVESITLIAPETGEVGPAEDDLAPTEELKPPPPLDAAKRRATSDDADPTVAAVDPIQVMKNGFAEIDRLPDVDEPDPESGSDIEAAETTALDPDNTDRDADTEVDSNETVDDANATEASAAQQTTTTTSSPAAGTSPIWSERWNAWASQDPETRRWFLHDEQTGRWNPLEVKPEDPIREVSE